MTSQSELSPVLNAEDNSPDAHGLIKDVHSLIEAMSIVRALLDIDIQSTNIYELSQEIADAMVSFPGFESCRLLLMTEQGRLECHAYASTPVPVVHKEHPEHSNLAVGGQNSMERFWKFPDIENDDVNGFDPETSTFTNTLKILNNHYGVLQVQTLIDFTQIPLIKPLMVLCGRLVEKLYATSNLIHSLDQAVEVKTRKLSEHTKRLQHEIEERKRIQQIADKERQRVLDFAEVAADWFWETDERLRFTYISDRFEALSGISHASLMGVTLLDFADTVRGSGWHGCVEDVKHRTSFKNFLFMSKQDVKQASVFNVCGRPSFDTTGKFLGYRGTGQDITQTHKLSEELAYHSQYDSLTGLQNRSEFEHCLSNALAKSCMDNSTSVLCYLDLDQFKVINETCGHSAGDELLCQIALILKQNTRDMDVVARLGGDEFGLLLRSCGLEKGAEKANKLCRVVKQHRFVWENRVFGTGVSIGVIPINRDSDSVGKILSDVDTACYMAKKNGRGRIHVQNQNSAELVRWHRNMEWVSKINWALENDRFELNHQPIIAVDHGNNECGVIYEVLIRMHDDSGETIMPGAFLPAAEQYSMVTEIDYWVVENLLHWLSDHPRHLEKLAMCCINLSGHSISDEEFTTHLSDCLSLSAVPPNKICFEVTETALISDLDKTKQSIDALRQRGCKFALDDFGSGVSSFAYLKTLPVDFVKIDGIFVRDIDEKPVNLEILRTINQVSHAMGKKTIAEYVEKESTLRLLRDIGIDYAQGYAIGKPRKLVS